MEGRTGGRAAICFAGAFWRFLRPTISNFEFWQLNDNRNLARFLAAATQRTGAAASGAALSFRLPKPGKRL